jgi:ABC-type antimicrobial peptide transport system permease subunit
MSFRRNNFRLAAQNLKAAKGRSFLTMLGIIIGVMAFILMVCIGQGVKQQISGQLGRFTKNAISIQPGTPNDSPVFSGLQAANGGLLTSKDLTTIQQTHGVSSAVPLAVTSGTMTGDHTINNPYIIATTADLPKIIHQSFASGGFFDPENGSKTVVLGSSIAQKLFDDNAPLGQGITWRGERFIVAGVYNDFHAPPFSMEANFNNAVFVPYTTAQSLSENGLSMFQILALNNDDSATDIVMQKISSDLTAAHGGAKDVTVRRAADGGSTSDPTIHLLTLLIIGAAAITLAVGGVGIMNVMLVSVTERMHEIGVRKAVGATNRQIMRQFVAEAFMLSLYGAIIGVLLSLGIIGLLRLFSGLQPTLVWQIMVIAPLLGVGTGILFGSIPALKAARKDPIDALRHE